MRRLWRLVAPIAVLVSMGVIAPCGTAVARDTSAKKQAAAMELFDKAMASYNLGHFADAAALFEKAYELDHAPTMLFNLGQCYRQLGDNEKALFFYRGYLAEAPAAPDHLEVERRVADLERSIQDQAALRRKPPPGLQAVPGAGHESTDQGKPEGTSTPSGVVPSAGSVPTPLAPGPASTPSAENPGVPRAVTQPALVNAGPEAPTDSAPPQAQGISWRRNVAWIGGGAAVVALGVGVGFHLAALGNLSSFNGSCGLTPGTGQPAADPTKPGRTNAECGTLYDDWKSDKLWSMVGYGAGAVFAATVAILVIAPRSNSDSAAQAHAHLRCTPSLGAVTCGGVF
jgi:hypothetical protein